MFVHESQLRHVLRPEHYYSEEHYRRELEHVLQPGWHPVATLAELPRGGRFVARTLLGRPLLLRRAGDEVHAFLNACAHRRRDDDHLAGVRSALCGELVFVCLADEGPSLEEQLGPHFAYLAESFAPPWRQVWAWEADYAANWKVPLENGLESYHIPCLHARTFGDYPQERNVEHELHETWTTYTTTEMDRWVKKAVRRATRWLGLPSTGTYTHLHVFPNLTFVSMDTFRMAQPVWPTSATTSSTRVWVFAPFGPRRGVIPWLFAHGNALAVAGVARRVLHEDAPIFPDAQRGLEASVCRGVMGRREERLHVFQEYVARRCGADTADPAG